MSAHELIQSLHGELTGIWIVIWRRCVDKSVRSIIFKEFKLKLRLFAAFPSEEDSPVRYIKMCMVYYFRFTICGNGGEVLFRILVKLIVTFSNALHFTPGEENPFTWSSFPKCS